MNVVFWNRSFTNLLSPIPVKYLIGPYSHSVIGGPKLAQIGVLGNDLDLWGLIDYIRRPVEIHSSKGEPVWWGMVNEIRADIGAWSIGVSIESMYNYIGVAFEDDSAGGLPKITDWAEATDSTAEYGRRELMISSSGSNEAHALVARDKYLAEKKYPTPIITKRDKGDNIAILYCKGWFDTLAWRYFSRVDNSVINDNEGAGEQQFGNSGSYEKIAQSFQVTEILSVLKVEIKIKIVGSPADDIYIDICQDSGGAPGAVLGSGSISGSLITENYEWTDIEFTGVNQIELSTGTTYWLVIRRSGGMDGSNYYKVDVDEDLSYTSGVFKIYNGGWISRTPDADLKFKVMLGEDTATQIENMINYCGEFFTAVDLETTSGIKTIPYRDGNGNGLYEITELLKMGTINKRRLLCEVTIDRRLRIYEEPEVPAYTHFITKDGVLRDPYNTPIKKETCPVGFWTRLKDIVPASLDTTKLADPTLQFIDEMEYFPDEDRINPTPRGFIDPFVIGVPKDG